MSVRWRFQVVISAVARMLLVTAALFTPAGAQEACDDASVGLCFGRYSAITAAAATTSGFSAMASMGNQLELLRLDRGGQPVGEVQLRRPDWLAPDLPAPVVNALAARPDGGILAIGWATQQGEDKLRQVGAIALVTVDGDATWLDPVTLDDKASIILHSAVYDASADRFMIVGRVTSGGDDGTCKEWSQAIAFSVSAEPEQSVSRRTIARFGSTGKGPRNRVALLDVVPGQKANEFVAVGFMTEANMRLDGCQDDAIAMRLEQANGSWRLGKPYALANSMENEVATAIVAAGGGRYVFAGNGALASKAKATLTGSFGFSGGPPGTQTLALPDAGDANGGDRYRALAAMRAPGKFLAAGSASASRAGRNQAIWTTIRADGNAEGQTRYLSRDGGSDILDLAVGSNGRILAVGTHGSGTARIGWLGMVLDQQLIAAKRRLPDPALPLIETNAATAFVDADIAKGTGLRRRSASAGQAFEMPIVLSAEMELSVSALAARGDLDMLLSAKDGRFVAQSSNSGDAGEYLSAKLPAGEYRLTAIAASDVGEYEVRLARQSLEAGTWSVLLQLDAATRQELAAQLESAGYGSAGNPTIAFGGDTVRAFLAYCMTFTPSLDPDAVSQFVPKPQSDTL